MKYLLYKIRLYYCSIVWMEIENTIINCKKNLPKAVIWQKKGNRIQDAKLMEQAWLTRKRKRNALPLRLFSP